ncbi:hypothetical protein BB559_000129 [Furculomyces boomerangus]|uniref:Uncharacterized protein n=1 Tax=Furculomyces boomerangus TaxID=61424 RepID=A0A2T9Z644_9FUNG|nr:hypothetical protein BB559_000129 [Furculomyces boomerangus]
MHESDSQTEPSQDIPDNIQPTSSVNDTEHLKADFPCIIWPELQDEKSFGGLEMGHIYQFSFHKPKTQKNYTNFLNQSHFENQLDHEQETGLIWETYNHSEKEHRYWKPLEPVKCVRPPIRKYEIDRNSFLNSRHSKNMSYNLTKYQNLGHIPQVITESLFSADIQEGYLKNNFDPFLGNRACMFYPEILAPDSGHLDNSWLAYTGGEIHNELRFYPNIETPEQSRSYININWDGLNLDNTYKPTFQTPILQLSTSPADNEFFFVRTHDQVSMIETGLDATLLSEASMNNLVPLKYGQIGNSYLLASNNRFINHCAPSPYNAPEVLLTSVDHSVRLWDFTDNSEQLLYKGLNYIENTIDWATTEYWNTPRTFLHADTNCAYIIDSRLKNDGMLNRFVSFSNFDKNTYLEKLVSIKPKALNPMHAVIGTTQNIRVYDMRYSKTPVILWRHKFPVIDPPEFLYTLNSDQSNFDKNIDITCSIVAASRRQTNISVFVYSQSKADGNPYISISQNNVDSFHTNDSVKAQLLDIISDTQFKSTTVRKKITQENIFPLPELSGFVINPRTDLKKRNPKSSKNYCDNCYSIFQLAVDGSLYKQNVNILSNLSSENQKSNETELEKMLRKGKTNNENDSEKVCNKHIENDSLYCKEVCRDVNLNLVDGNGQLFISYNQNVDYEKSQKLKFANTEWPFIRNDFREVLQYFYQTISRDNIFFSKADILPFTKISKHIIESGTSSINRVLDSVLYLSLCYNIDDMDKDSLNDSLEKYFDLKKINGQSDTIASVKLLSEVVLLSSNFITYFYKIDNTGELTEKNISASDFASNFRITKTMLNPLNIKLRTLLENRIIDLIFSRVYKSQSTPEETQTDTLSKLEEKLKMYTVDAIHIPGLGKIGICEENISIFGDLLEKQEPVEIHDLLEILTKKYHGTIIDLHPETPEYEYCRNFYYNSLYYLLKDLFLSTTLLKPLDRKKIVGSATNKKNNSKSCYIEILNLKKVPKLQSAAKVLERLWEKESIYNKTLSATSTSLDKHRSKTGKSRLEKNTVSNRSADIPTQSQSQSIPSFSTSQPSQSNTVKKTKKKSRKVGF